MARLRSCVRFCVRSCVRFRFRSWCRQHLAAGPVPAEVVNPFLSTAFIDRLEVL